MAKFLSEEGLALLCLKIKEEFDNVYENIINNEKVIAHAFNDIKKYIDNRGDKIINGCNVTVLEDETVLDSYTVEIFKPAILLLQEEDFYHISSVNIIMGDVNITPTSYNNSTYTININKVTDDIIIRVTTIDMNPELTLSGVVATYNPPTYGENWEISFVPDTDKQLLPNSVAVSIDGTDVTETAFNIETNKITISSVTSAVSITARAEAVNASYLPLAYIDAPVRKNSNTLITSYLPNSNTKFEFDVKMETPNYVSALYTVRSLNDTPSASTPQFTFITRYGNTGNLDFAWGSVRQWGSAKPTGLIGNTRTNFICDKGAFSYKNQYGNTYTQTLTCDAWALSGSNYLRFFGYQTSDSNTNNASYGTIYGAKVSEDGVVMGEWIPAKRLSDGACGVYDLVKNTWVGNTNWIAPYATITRTLTNVTNTIQSSVTTGNVVKAVYGQTWICKYTPSSGYNMFSEFSVMINNVDKTSEVATYDSTTNEYTVTLVAHWNDTISITANAVDVITFEDDAVKAICVENWGGGTIAGEITKAEAAAVTSLGGVFYNNTTITKFNELQYFTGLLNLYKQLDGGHVAGQFFKCENLVEVTLPQAPISSYDGAFRACKKLKTVDFTPIISSHQQLACICRDCTALTSVTLKGGNYEYSSGSGYHAYYAFRACASLTTINIDGTANWSKITGFTSAFYNCIALTTINGTITGINASIDFSYCPLSLESATMIVNGLSSTGSGKTCTFKSSMQATYEADADFNTAVTNATANGWTIAYA